MFTSDLVAMDGGRFAPTGPAAQALGPDTAGSRDDPEQVGIQAKLRRLHRPAAGPRCAAHPFEHLRLPAADLDYAAVSALSFEVCVDPGPGIGPETLEPASRLSASPRRPCRCC